MTVTMENCAEMDKPLTADKDVGETGVPPSQNDSEEIMDQNERFARERQLILLSVLFKLYGEEWKESPDWAKVSEEIKSAKIPIFGENFPPDVCENMYKSFMEIGYRIGFGPYAMVLKVPSKLSDGQKRIWILASTSADLSYTSERLDKLFRDTYKEDYEFLKNLYIGNSDIKSQAVADALEVSSESGSDKGDKEEYEDPEAAKVALELEQAELNKDILGFNDVLAMTQYCSDAAEYATKLFPQLEEFLKQEVRRKQDDTKSLSSSSEPTPSKLGGKIFTEKELESCLTPAQPKAPSTPVTPVEKETPAEVVKPPPPVVNLISPEEDLPEKTKAQDHNKGKVIIEIDVSPEKSLTKANNKDITVIQESSKATSDNCDAEMSKCSGDNGEEPGSQPLTAVTNVKTVGTGQEENDESTDGKLAKVAGVKEPGTSDPTKEKPVVIDLSISPEKEDEGTGAQKEVIPVTPVTPATPAVVPTGEVDTPKSIPVTNAKEQDNKASDDLNKTVSPETIDITEISPESVKDDKRQEEVAGKEKVAAQGSKKKESGSSGRTTRTSSRLTSPEPNEPPKEHEEQKCASAKKSVSRQSSSQQSTESPPHTPALRSRRGATPTKAVEVIVIESPCEPVTRSSTPSKANNSVPVPPSVPASASTEDTEEETFETPRSTPESTEMGKSSDVESTNKPPKPVKVYSVKPPSPLSQVDPRLLDEFIDEDEDAELVEIDSNINKAKGLKGSTPNKSLSLRGRTVSSENASDAGGQTNEDNTPAKRVTRKLGLNEDAEEDGACTNEEGESKRLTRSSLKLHDAANEESAEAPQTESEKAASESSFGGKEKKPRPSKQLLRVKKLHDEKNRFYGEDNEESPDGKRLTRARAKTSTSSTSVAEKRSKPPSVGDSEGLSESEPTPTRATRSRSSTTTNTPAPVEPQPSASQISTVSSIEDEEQKNLRKNICSLFEKIVGSEAAALVVKSLQDDQTQISNWNADLARIKKNIEQGKLTVGGVHAALNVAILNVVIRMPNSPNISMDVAEPFHRYLTTSIEEFKTKPGETPQPKNDNSDVESLESHDEQRSETSSSKQTPVGGGGGGRRKRKRSTSETSEEVLPPENKRRVTRTSTSSSTAYSTPVIHRKTKHPISPDIVSANRVRH